VVKRVKNNAYRLDMPNEYEVHATFNVSDLIPFTGSIDDEKNPPDLRTNHFQEAGNP